MRIKPQKLKNMEKSGNSKLDIPKPQYPFPELSMHFIQNLNHIRSFQIKTDSFLWEIEARGYLFLVECHTLTVGLFFALRFEDTLTIIYDCAM